MSGRGFLIATSGKANPISAHFTKLASVLAGRGHEVTLVVDGRRRDLERRLENPRVLTWPSPRPVRLRDAVFLAKAIGRRRVDCLVANFGSVNAMLLVGWLMRVPHRIAWYHTISTAIDLDARAHPLSVRFQRWRRRHIYRLATLVVANSEAGRRDVSSVFGVSPSRTRACPNSLPDPLDNVRLAGIAAGPRRGFVCVGRFDRTKGQDLLIEAVGRGCSRSLRVDFVGDGPRREACERLAAALGVADRCVFRGRLPNDEALACMAGAVATIVPSRSEAFGLVNVESLALGTPVLGTVVGGMREVVRDGVDGLLVEPHAGAIASALATLDQRPDLARDLGARARAGFLARFEQTLVVGRQAAFFEALAAGAPRPLPVLSHR
jgi:glycosyltransferase involved in cell wall biosynthesis